uniref:Uncharacterized protein n=1 Tax=Pseudomonas fluorescens (strain SBW25) TaxID=216595 RepID=A4V6V9_PSEFS|nr:hypothetical protein [Pseudomonas fluorescens]CAM96270.1 hypothetical protein pQBR0238 [Pseudomonas fluorescens SBW25]
MNPAFEEALAARLLWINVAALAGIEGCEAQTEAALEAAYNAVHDLASNDVLTYRHYGLSAPLLLQDVPELADQYNLAYELYTELYCTNLQNGSVGKLSASWLKPEPHEQIPYTKWLAAVDSAIALLMGTPVGTTAHIRKGHYRTVMHEWARGETPVETATDCIEAYECNQEMLEEEAYRAHCQDIHDTYASIEADLWAGWREECEDLGLVA